MISEDWKDRLHGIGYLGGCFAIGLLVLFGTIGLSHVLVSPFYPIFSSLNGYQIEVTRMFVMVNLLFIWGIVLCIIMRKQY